MGRVLLISKAARSYSRADKSNLDGSVNIETGVISDVVLSKPVLGKPNVSVEKFKPVLEARSKAAALFDLVLIPMGCGMTCAGNGTGLGFGDFGGCSDVLAATVEHLPDLFERP